MATVANRIGDADPLELLALSNLDGSIPAVSAAKWTTPRTLSFTGNVTGSGSVDGSANVATALTIGAGQVTEAMQVLANNTTNNVSTSKHGYAPILPNDATKYLDGTGSYSVPAGGGGSGTVTSVSLSTPLGGGTVTTSGTLGTTSYTNHGVVLGQGASALAVTAAGGANTFLAGVAGADPTFRAVNIATADVTGVLPVANGGTGSSSGLGWVLISEQSPSGTGTVSFTSIPATYRDLRLVVRGAGTKTAAFVEVRVQFNADTGGNYDVENIIMNNATNLSGGAVAGTYVFLGWIAAASGVSNGASHLDLFIANYRDTTFIKSFSSMGGVRTGTAASNMFAINSWGNWRSTAAINRVDAFLDANNFTAGSVVSLYGSY